MGNFVSGVSLPHLNKSSSSAKAEDPVRRSGGESRGGSGILDRPLSRAMTAGG
jgi:hypothetical protein